MRIASLAAATRMGVAIVALHAVAAQAADIKVFVTSAARDAFNELAPPFERATGHKTNAQFDLPPGFLRRIDAGETFDVIILSMDVDGLIRQGKVMADSRTVLGRTGIGVVIRQGAPKPDFGTVDAFKRMLLAAPSIAYSGEGSSGRYFLTLLDRLGVADAIRPKLRTPSGVGGAPQLLARGEAELAMIGRPPVIGVAGIEWLGWIPDDIQNWIVFTAGLSTTARDPAAGRALLSFLTSPAGVAVFKSKGFDPAAP
jgi:molybdate transport system substrate-binding protein